jgi:group I intron endonuclease
MQKFFTLFYLSVRFHSSTSCTDNVLLNPSYYIFNFSSRIYLNALAEKKLLLKENKNLSGVYCWFNNINGNFYIGSAKDLNNRLARYFRPSELKRSKNSLIHKALLKYACCHNNFSLFVLEYNDTLNLIEREQYYFDLLQLSYNLLITAGSWLGFSHSVDSKEKMSLIKKSDLNTRKKGEDSINWGRKHSEAFKLNLSIKRTGSNNSLFGKTHSEETKLKISLTKKGKPLTQAHKDKIVSILYQHRDKLKLINSKLVYLYSYDNLYSLDLKLITTFLFYREAAEYFNCSHTTIVRYIKLGDIFQNKYILSLKELHNSIENLSIEVQNKINLIKAGYTFLKTLSEETKLLISKVKGTIIYQYSLDIKLLNTFPSSKAAAKHFSCDGPHIMRYARLHHIFRGESK